MASSSVMPEQKYFVGRYNYDSGKKLHSPQLSSSLKEFQQLGIVILIAMKIQIIKTKFTFSRRSTQPSHEILWNVSVSSLLNACHGKGFVDWKTNFARVFLHAM